MITFCGESSAGEHEWEALGTVDFGKLHGFPSMEKYQFPGFQVDQNGQFSAPTKWTNGFCPINFFQTVNANVRRTLLCGHRLHLLSGCRSKGRRCRLRRNHLLHATSSLRLGVAVCKMLEEQTIQTKFILDCLPNFLSSMHLPFSGSFQKAKVS